MDPSVGEPEIPQEVSLAPIGKLHPGSLCPLSAGSEHVILLDDVLDVGRGVYDVQVLRAQSFHDRPGSPLERIPVGAQRREVYSCAQVGHLRRSHAGAEVRLRHVQALAPRFLEEELRAMGDEATDTDVFPARGVPHDPGDGVHTFYRAAANLSLVQLGEEPLGHSPVDRCVAPQEELNGIHGILQTRVPWDRTGPTLTVDRDDRTSADGSGQISDPPPLLIQDAMRPLGSARSAARTLDGRVRCRRRSAGTSSPAATPGETSIRPRPVQGDSPWGGSSAASACASQKPMSISRYIVTAVFRCSWALAPSPMRR